MLKKPYLGHFPNDVLILENAVGLYSDMTGKADDVWPRNK